MVVDLDLAQGAKGLCALTHGQSAPQRRGGTGCSVARDPAVRPCRGGSARRWRHELQEPLAMRSARLSPKTHPIDCYVVASRASRAKLTWLEGLFLEHNTPSTTTKTTEDSRVRSASAVCRTAALALTEGPGRSSCTSRPDWRARPRASHSSSLCTCRSWSPPSRFPQRPSQENQSASQPPASHAFRCL